MLEIGFRGLAQFGLPLVTAADERFAGFVREIEESPWPAPGFGPGDFDAQRAAVLLNESGRAIIAYSILWRYANAGGKERTHRISNFGSSAQREALCGRSAARRDAWTFILPGSKRLITERGVFGSNLDVLGDEERQRGFCGGVGGGSGGWRRGESEGELQSIELVVDFAVLEDGLCVGPDESETFEALKESLERQRTVARDVLTALERGEPDGRIFEMVRPLAQHRPVGPPGHGLPLASSFGMEAVHRLVNGERAQIVNFFEREAAEPALQLRRP